MTRTLTIQNILDATDGSLVVGEADVAVRRFSIDSRIPTDDDTLFIALRGPNFDGHDFLAGAAARGATCALVSEDHDDIEAFEAVVRVDDTLTALQAIAATWRDGFDGTVVGVTGSNGKTIVKEMLTGIVGTQRSVYRSPGSFNSQVGVPLSALGIRDDHEIAILEAGISEVGEMERLQPVVKPDIGVITNIGEAHLAGFGELEVTAKEKLKLFDQLDGPLVWPADDDVLRETLTEISPGTSFGEAEAADYRVVDIRSDDRGFDFGVEFPSGSREDFRLNVRGQYNVSNAAAAIACADQLAISPDAMRAGLARYELAPMRLEMHTTGGGVTLLNDSYSSDPVSASAALKALVQYAAGQPTIAILGDMRDLGPHSKRHHEELGRMVCKFGIDHLVCVGPLAQAIGRAAEQRPGPSTIDYVAGVEDLDELLDDLAQPGSFVLFKGSRSVGLERAAESLLESVAPTRLYVDLDAIRDNVQAIRGRVGDSSGVMAVVKSFGYGNDANRVALTLADAGVDAFCVAYPDEAIPLRRRGIDSPILVTNVRASEADKIVKYALTPLVFAEATVDAIERQAERRGRVIDVHVEVDTGMNRLGVEPSDTLQFCERIAASPHLRLDGVMTHFAAADDPAEDDFTRGQIAAFETALTALEAADLRPNTVHAANTAAAWRFPQAKYDLVRIGLGLYGVHPSTDVGAASTGVRPALEFVTEVIFVKDVEPGESVGYGRTWKAPERTRIATIAAGYNDGFPRFMSNGGEVLVRSVRCPVVGNVCMDVSMVDVTDVPDVEVGDEVVIFGRRGSASVSIEEIAARGGTINYEILTNISARVRRIFRR